MVSRKSHVSELKNWMPMHSKTKKKPSIGVELRAGGDPHRSEKPGWSASDTWQWPQKRNGYASGFSQGSFAVRFFDLFKVNRITTKFFDLFKVNKMTISIMTCSKSTK